MKVLGSVVGNLLEEIKTKKWAMVQPFGKWVVVQRLC